MMEEIIKYVMETPENTNGNILREQLKGVGFDESNIEEAIRLIIGNLGSLNWNILREELESLDGSGSSAKTRRVLFEGELTTENTGSTTNMALLPSISDWPFDKTSIVVIFDGSEYMLPKGETVLADSSSGSLSGTEYGNAYLNSILQPSFAHYPCAMVAYEPEYMAGATLSRGVFMTENPGTYNVKIEVEK